MPRKTKKTDVRKSGEGYYEVGVPEVHISWRKVKASCSNEAIVKVADGDGDEVELAYDTTLEQEKWRVREAL